MARLDDKLDRVESQLDLLTERSLKSEIGLTHVQQNSKERLETINRRFDEIHETIDTNNSRDRWINSMFLSALVVIGSVVFYLWMEPIGERLYEVEKRLADIATQQQPE